MPKDVHQHDNNHHHLPPNLDDLSVHSNKSSNSLLSKNTTNKLPRCHCSWKNCRSWQKTFHHVSHPIFDGIIKISWSKKDDALKAKWDKFLKVDEAKRLGKRYFVARHHFTEELLNAYISDIDNWNWSDKWSKSEAELYYGFVPLSAASEEKGLYWKLPLVPRDNVKEIIKKVRKEMEANTIPEDDIPKTLHLGSIFTSPKKTKSKSKDSSASERQTLSLSPDPGRKHGKKNRHHHAGKQSAHSSSPPTKIAGQSLEPPIRRGTPEGESENSQSVVPIFPPLPLSEELERGEFTATKSLEPPSRNNVNSEDEEIVVAAGETVSPTQSKKISRHEIFDDDEKDNTIAQQGISSRSLTPPRRPGIDDDDDGDNELGSLTNKNTPLSPNTMSPLPQRNNERGPSEGLTKMLLEEEANNREAGERKNNGENSVRNSTSSVREKRSSEGITYSSSRKLQADLHQSVRKMEAEEEQSVSGGYSEDDTSPFGGADSIRATRTAINIIDDEEEKKDGTAIASLEMMQIAVQDYQALVSERDELRSTADEQAVSINMLNKLITGLKKDVAVYKERGASNNDKLDGLEGQLGSAYVAAATRSLDGGVEESKDSLATIEALKTENQRLQKKSEFLAQRNKTYESTIKELEEKMEDICDSAVDREKQLQGLLVRNPWQMIANTIFPDKDDDEDGLTEKEKVEKSLR